MVICPKCKTEYDDGVDFCEKDGAKLIRGGSDSAAPETPPSIRDAGNNEPRTDELAVDADIEALRAELARRDAHIRQLETELDVARRELQTLRDQVTAEHAPGKPTGPRLVGKKTGSKSDSVALEKTEVVVPPPRTYGWLIGAGGIAAGERYAIGDKGLQIGRAKKFSEAGGISINDKRVSNPHAWIGVVKDAVIVRDEGSTNGTYLNDPDSERIEEARLSSGDTIIIAERDVAEFVFKK